MSEIRFKWKWITRIQTNEKKDDIEERNKDSINLKRYFKWKSYTVYEMQINNDFKTIFQKKINVLWHTTAKNPNFNLVFQNQLLLK